MTLATINFGAYVLQPINDALFIGAGNSPGNEDGASIISGISGDNLTREIVLDEQGVHDIHNQNGELWVCGTDPVEPSNEWSLGNIYHRDLTGNWTKYRTLPLTIHALGCTHDGTNLWVAGGMHTGDNATWKGRILKSSDNATNWTAVDVNNYRLYDVIYNTNLYAVGYDWTGSAYTQDLYSSVDGTTWNKIAGIIPALKPRLIIHNGEVYGVSSNMTSIFNVNGDLYTTPFTIASNWNVIDSDNTYFYVLSTTGDVYRTSDFNTWVSYTTVSNAVSIKYWTEHGLLISDIGVNAKIWLA